MIELENFEQHLNTLSFHDWNKLFELIPQIEKNQKFREPKDSEKLKNGSYSFPYWASSELVDKTFEIINTLNLVPIFDWTSWIAGKTILNDKEFDYLKLDTITLCKLFTLIIRADRFSEGFMASCFESGVMLKIIKALKNRSNQKINIDVVRSALFGVAVGDALGVPVEFKSRETISRNKVTDMIGFGTYNLLPGTWSDDSSLTFCLAEALTNGFDLHEIGQNFIKWAYEGYWTPRGIVFDIGIATSQAIYRLKKGEIPELAGGFDEYENGNGSLMRILPLLFYISDKPLNERYQKIKQVSSITHGHIRSVIACFYYLEFAKQLIEQKDKFEIYQNLKVEITNFLITLSINQSEISWFDSLLKSNIYEQTEANIKSSGYVLHTIEASIWCLLTTNNYKDAVLKAVNLGEDTDTTGAVTGGLAGLLYGINNIPKSWLQQLARKKDIENLAERFAKKFARH
ncbi:ADP-ribosylglycohydrolase family protein [Sphingobacterium sp. SRCM116780]|uniref:ADP-ribosylglycohydrolase family protein n=1 Tax=Sphingobacterium sp. SRCM116780 TaxID=2907623 RepID=UPI001F31A914|nr:ADP-ribosylglycohydrolase family protein [Sphingobacterium sp. SRCM116780]UIR57905.1 ADP-ribosylglycohydrolase family protein [Sphingobacterium sp. SRCM116780]